MTEMKGQRHHLVPQFHLRRFGDSQRQLAVIHRGDGDLIYRSVRQSASAMDFYAFQTSEGSTSYELEQALSQIESAAALVIERLIDKPDVNPSEGDRVALATFLAFQVARGTQFRAQFNQIVDWWAKFTWANTPRDPERLKKILSERGVTPTDEKVAELMEGLEHPERFEVEADESALLRASMETAVEMGPYLIPREWNILRCDEPLFVTSDQPVTLWSKPRENSFYGAGIATADEVRFPLDPSHFLVLTPPGLAGLHAEIGSEWAPELNRLTIASAHEWVFAHPSHPQLEQLTEWARTLRGRKLVIDNGTTGQPDEAQSEPKAESWLKRTVRRLLHRRSSHPG